MEESQRTIYEFSAPLLVGRLMSLAELRGRVLLIVNTATPPRRPAFYAPVRRAGGAFPSLQGSRL